jgi:hypothetical protein
MIEVVTSLNTDKMALKRRLQRQLIITNYDPKIVAKQGHADYPGARRREVIDIYDHINNEGLRRACLAHVLS